MIRLTPCSRDLGQGILSDSPHPSGAAAVGAVMVYFAVIGFFYGYLNTRLFLAGAFLRADQEEAGKESPS